MFRSRAFHVVLGFSVSTVLLVWLYFAIDWHEVAGELRGIHYWVIVPSLAVLGLHFAVRAVRWKHLLSFGAATRFGHRFDSIMVGNFANFVLPFRAGEFIRPYLFSRWTKESCLHRRHYGTCRRGTKRARVYRRVSDGLRGGFRAVWDE